MKIKSSIKRLFTVSCELEIETTIFLNYFFKKSKVSVLHFYITSLCIKIKCRFKAIIFSF